MKPTLLLTLFLLASLCFSGCSDGTPIQGRSLPEWLQALKADDATRRLQAVQVLAEHVRNTNAVRQLVAPRVVRALEGALRDRHQSVRLQAAMALASRGIDSTMTVPVLLEGIRDGGIESIHQSVDLALAHHSRTIESSLSFVLQLMERRLKDIEPLSASRPAERAAAQQQKALAAALVRLKSPAEPAVLAALGGLADGGLTSPATVIPAVSALLKNSNPRLRAAAAERLGNYQAAGFPALLDLTELIVKDPDPVVRAAAVRAAMHIDPHSGNTVSYIYGALYDGAPEVRRAAAEALAEFGPSAQAISEPLSSELLKAIIWPRNIAMRVIEPAVPPLLRVMADADPGARAAAAATLGHVAPEAAKVVPALQAALADADPGVRAAAAGALGELSVADPAVIARLRPLLLQDAQPAVRGAALLALVRIARNDGDVLPLLEAAARDTAPPVQSAFLQSLAIIGPGNLFVSKTLSDALQALLAHPDPAMRAAAARVIARADLRTDHAVQMLAKALEDKSPEVALAAAEALSSMGSAADLAAPAFEKLMHRNPRLRLPAAVALGWINRQTSETAQGLLTAMREPAFWQGGPWREAMLMLGWRGAESASAMPVMAGLLKDQRNSVEQRMLAAMVLASMTTQTLPTQIPPLFRQVRASYHQRQVESATALIWLGERAAPALPELTRMLQSHTCPAELRVAAAAAVGKMGTTAADAVPDLCDVLREEKDPQVRAALAAVVGGLGIAGKTATPPLISALKDADAGVREAAALALGKIAQEAPFAVPALVAALGDAEPRVRLAAAMGLGGYGPAAKDALNPLNQLAGGDADPLVRKAAALARKKITAE